MNGHEEKYLISAITSWLCLVLLEIINDLVYKTDIWFLFGEKVGWPNFVYWYHGSYPFIFSILAMLGGFWYLKRQGLPLGLRLLFLLLSPVTLYFSLYFLAFLRNSLSA